MPNIWFTSDLHFCHDKDFIWLSRGFNSVQEMNEVLVERYNSLVKDEDIVYILGDSLMGDAAAARVFWDQLKGHKIVILGNHDTKPREAIYRETAEAVLYADLIKVGKYNFYLSHYPTLVGNFAERHGPWNLYGHTHTKYDLEMIENRCYNIGVDAHDCYPINIEQVIENIKNKKESI